MRFPILFALIQCLTALTSTGMQSVWADGPLSTLINRIESAETQADIPIGTTMKDPALLKMKLFKKLPKYLALKQLFDDNTENNSLNSFL